LSLLLLVSLLGVSVSHFRASRTIQRLEAERAALRNEVGFLKIEDESKAYVRSLGSLNALTWRFRVYLPPDGNYRVCSAFQYAEPGFPEAKRTGRVFSGGGEFLLTAAFHRSGNGDWVLRISTPWVGSQIPDRAGQLDWLSEPWADKSPIITTDQKSFAPDQPIPILRLQAARTAHKLGIDAGSPTDGFVLWIEPLTVRP
jgi:hypothetical protein